MKLEVEMYIRTKGGFIDKIVSFKSTISNDYVELEDEYYANKKDILKASHNTIDLIEIGDYVNGSRVIEINEYDGEKYVYVEETEYSNANQTDINIYYKNEDIKSIVTKEQFEAIQYKVV